MADYLINFTAGENIKASETNSNNQYLLDKISDNSSEVQAYIATQISSLTSQFETFKQEVQTQLDELEESFTTSITSVSEAFAPDYNSGESIDSGTTITEPGYLNWYSSSRSNNVTNTLDINGVRVGYYISYKYTNALRFQFRVTTGDVIEFSSGSSCSFYPCKGFKEEEEEEEE